MTRLSLGAFAIAMMSTAAVAHASDPGTAGFLSLRLGAGARSAAMGDANVSLVDDATAAYWNPAGLTGVQRTEFTLMHLEWLSSVRMETASVAHATEIGTFGLHFSGLYLDEMERIETASGTPTGHFNFYEFSLSLAYGRRISDNFDIGAALKGLHGEIDAIGASGWAVDFGARYRTRIEGLTFAAAAQNLGPKMSYIEEEFVLPSVGRVGADYQRPMPSLNGRVAAAFELLFPTDGDARQHFGFEYVFKEFAAARVGYKAAYDSQGLTFGAGLTKSGYRFDYAYVDIDNDLGTGHKFAFSIDL